MPIGQAPFNRPDATRVRYDNAVAAEIIAPGHAVAIVDVAGTQRIYRCGATTYPDQWAGFADQAAVIGQAIYIASGRGSRITPVVEGGGPLTANQRVYLSMTPGEVTSTPVARGPGVFTVPVGLAVSTTQFTLLSDAKVKFP
jgi:hypothetical protein